MKKPLKKMDPPTAEFLEELRERARRYGWNGDYVEVADFVRSLYGEAGLTTPNQSDMEPYPIDPNTDERVEP